jgi:hypothetical protein
MNFYLQHFQAGFWSQYPVKKSLIPETETCCNGRSVDFSMIENVYFETKTISDVDS